VEVHRKSASQIFKTALENGKRDEKKNINVAVRIASLWY